MARKWHGNDLEKFKVRVLYLCGLSILDIKNSGHVALRNAAIGRTVKLHNLSSCRMWNVETRARKLAALETEAFEHSPESAGIVEVFISAFSQQARYALETRASTLSALMNRTGGVKEIVARRDLLKAFEAVRDTNIVSLIENPNLEIIKAKGTTRNIANCPIDWLLAKEKIELWHWEASIKYRSDYERASIGGLRSSDIGSGFVDNGRDKSVISDGAAMSLDQIAEVKAAITVGFSGYPDLQRAEINRLLAEYVIGGKTLTNFKTICGEPLKLLKLGLEAVAWAYRSGPSTDITKYLDKVAQSRGGKIRVRKGVDA